MLFGQHEKRRDPPYTIIAGLARRRAYGFSLERAVFLTVLHRLFCSGSDRAASIWRTDYRIDQAETLSLHHLYRTMAWLGEALPAAEQAGKTPFAQRCTNSARDYARQRKSAMKC